MKFGIAAAAFAAAATLALYQLDGVTSQAFATVEPANADAAIRAKLDTQVPAWLKTHGVPSVSIAVIRDGAIAWTAAYGEQGPGKVATPSTLYNVASMTKPITAETVMRLASQGKLGIDEPMWPHWVDPDILADPRHKLLTPRLSLSHRTGFPNWRRETVKVLKFTFDPGTKSSYSGEGYEYVARFAEKKLGERFDALAQRVVLEPLGLKETSYNKRDWFKDRVAQPFDKKFLEPDFPDTGVASDLVYSTAPDYAKFMIAVMNNQGVSEKLAAERKITVDDFAAEVCAQAKLVGDNCPTRLGFGMGWAVVNYKNETVIMHGGSDTGAKTQGYFVPERRFGVVIFTNGENGNKIIHEVAAAIDPASPYVAFLAMQAR
jgi:CubicO group peptidase (beta-lactamase class C family)